MRVRLDGLGEEGLGFLGGAGGAERQERLGVGPVGASILVIGLQELLQGLVVADLEKGGGEDVANALVVAGIEPEHVAVVGDRFVPAAQGP
jgi:hypothetical protein